MPKCQDCGKNVREPVHFYYCPTCGGPLCPECRPDHSHAD